MSEYDTLPPNEDEVTDYDRAHLKTYVRLLDANAAGADWHEVAAVVLGLDPDADAAHAQRIHAAHLARAQWMTSNGFGQILGRN